MRSDSRRLGWFAAATLACVVVAAPAAQAQSDQSLPGSTVTTVNLNATTALPYPTVEAPYVYHPKIKADFSAAPLQPGAVASGRSDSGIGVGVSAMLIRGSLKCTNCFNLDNRNGYGFGFWVGGNRNGAVGFTGEFNFIQYKVGEGTTEAKIRVFQIPAVFHINFGSRSRNGAGGYAVVGPAVAFKMKESFTGGFGQDNFGGVDVSLIAGAGFEIVRIGFELRGNWGFTNIAENGTTSDIKTKEVQFLVKFALN